MKIKKKKIYFLFCIDYYIFILAFFLYFLNSSPFESELLHEFEVQKVLGVKRIARELKRQGFIRSEKLLVAISYLFDSDKNFKEGKYLISKNFSTFDVYKELFEGKSCA